MSDQKINVQMDFTQAETSYQRFVSFIEAKTRKVIMRGLGLLSAITSATGTTLGRQISLVISGAQTSYTLLYHVMQAQASNPWTAILAASSATQLSSLWSNIIQAVSGKEDISRGFNAITSRLTTIVGTVSYR